MISSMTLTRDGAAGRPAITRSDAAIAVVVSAFAILTVITTANPDPGDGAAHHIGALLPDGFAAPLALLITLPLLWRTVAPQPAIALAFGGVLLNFALVGDEFLRCGFTAATAMLLGFSAAAQGGRLAALAGVVGMVLVEFVLELGVATSLVAAAISAAVFAIGRVVHSRRVLSVQLAARTDELRAARDERAQMEVATERERVSSELEGLLQRRLGELAALAEAGADDPDPAARLTAIEHASRETLAQMRKLTGVLRDSEPSPTSPQPTLTHLESVLARRPGTQLRVQGSPRTLPPAVELTAFRVLEHLLEAMANAPGVEVCVRFGDDALELDLSGPAQRSATAALERARERVRLHDGTLQTSVRRGHAHAHVSLPVHAAVS